MRTKETIRPITYMKTHASDILTLVSERRGPVIITDNGEGKMVIQDIESYQATRRSLAMLKLVAMGRQSTEKGKIRPADTALRAIATRTKRRRGAQ